MPSCDPDEFFSELMVESAMDSRKNVRTFLERYWPRIRELMERGFSKNVIHSKLVAAGYPVGHYSYFTRQTAILQSIDQARLQERALVAARGTSGRNDAPWSGVGKPRKSASEIIKEGV